MSLGVLKFSLYLIMGVLACFGLMGQQWLNIAVNRKRS
jgi:hypothetical protein